ncbi:SusC/RagA family TonB-linked outer membrane protein [Lutibacter sp.]|uniref:SusC/RagA family TonB-linked outer membrane protein n=1 Tax=Lutibacter sp. TaxID=1925666 RepID=UPI001A1BBE9C|nr:SusC/RagA family TonB-linked outer membrane protein [Lutibacter sp.]MBI9040770.1 SusC/RagA family TonB-linked outer membrane protein [Lutibacter sp.]
MKKLLPLLMLVFSLAFTQQISAQLKTISGTVTAESDGAPLPGVNVVIQGTTKGSQTDFDGKYSIEASKGDVLVFSFIGMKTKSVNITDATTLNIVLADDALSLNEVIVTALGMKKEKKALTYSAQEVKGDDLTKVKQTNPINSLSGKSAGLTITKSSSGVGGASKVVLRGNSSTTNNDPLYVIDGVPMLNSGNGQNGEEPGTSIFGGQIGNRDGGDALSLLNPDDIESMSVLKGASAAALYGSQGANGVILITTKSGKDGKVQVNFSSSITVDDVVSLPELQTEYQSNSVGQPIAENGNVTDPKSWGAKKSGLTNSVNDFFKTGNTAIQSISLTAGNEKAQTFFSYANTTAAGVMPNNSMVRNNLNLRETANFLNNKIQVSANINVSDQRIWNRSTNGLYSNPLTGLYLNPVGIDLNTYKNKFEYFNTSTNMMDQYATSFDENIQQNPYWLVNRNPSKDIAQRVLANVSVKYQVTEDLSFQSRGSFDKTFFTFDKRMYAGSDLTFVPTTGRYILEKTENTQQYIDLIASYSKDISEDFTFSGVLGTSLTKYSVGDQLLLDSGTGRGLTYPNVFTIGNFASTNDIKQSVSNKEVQSIFGSANFGYKNKLFLDITGRSDWSSTLVNTDTNSFFYPSVGATGVLSEMFKMPENISFAKIRASYAVVGKDIPAYATIPLNSIPVGQGNFTKPLFGVKEGETLKPEEQKSFEIGTEWRFFHNRLGIDFTYYNSKTTDQIFFIAAEPNVNGYVQNIVNAGEISNSGIELVLNAKPIVGDIFNWNTTLNFATNKNKVVSVHPSLQNGEAILTAPGVNGYGYSLIEGEDFGSIRGRSVKRNAEGLPIVTDDAGSLTLETTDFETIAHAQPDFTFGWSNTFDYKNFSLNLLIDAKFGGEVVSVTESVNDFYGVSQASANARNTNGGMINVVDTSGAAKQMSAQDYYLKTGGRAGLLGEYVYDATNVSLREISLGYNLKFEKSFVENLRLSVIANNLFFIYKDAPFDPNIASSTGIGLQGVDIYGQPSTRSIGLNINVNF